MWDDAKPSSHAIVVRNVTSSADITSLFDSITYSKGASILRMLEKIVGSNTFRDGLRDYLTMNAFDVGDPSIFYNRLFTNISGEEFMKNWLEELNYPILNVYLNVDNNGTYVTFNQSRFIISNAFDLSNLTSNYRWKINIQCVLGGNSSETDTIEFILETERETQVLAGKFYTWIKCNRDFQGFYVTNYSSDLTTVSAWQRFASILEAQPNVNLIKKKFLFLFFNLVFFR
jgi:glutamyl aminopeptidase